jgi:hypothetical protein
MGPYSLAWRKEMGPAPAAYINKKGNNNLEERSLVLAVLEKGCRSLKSWRKEMGTVSWRKEMRPCSVGERR